MQIKSERGHKLWWKYLSNFKIITAERKEKTTKLEPTIWKEKYFLCFQALSQPESTQKIIAQKLCMFQQVTGHAPGSIALKLTAWNTCRQHNMSAVSFITRSITPSLTLSLLGDSGGVVNSLDFCLASFKSLGCFYFRCVLSSQWKAVTVNLRILQS